MRIYFKFKKFYHGGENSAPIFETEEDVLRLVEAVPRHTDRVMFNDKEYFVYKVTHILPLDTLVDRARIEVIATRRVEEFEIGPDRD
jgi:hypothetical protein